MDDLLHYAQQLASQASTPIFQPIQGRVVYMVNVGHSSGSSDSQHLAEAFNQYGFETLCIVRPGWPWDVEGKKNSLIMPEVNVNGVRYIHSELASDVVGNEQATLEATVDQLIKLLRIYRPSAIVTEIIDVGLPAWIAAKRLGIVFYGTAKNIGLIEDNIVDHQSKSLSSKFTTLVERSTFVAKQASKIYSKNKHLKKWLIENGVKEDSIYVLPNLNNAQAIEEDSSFLLKKIKSSTQNVKVLGYIGDPDSCVDLNYLLDSCEQLIEEGEKIKLLLVSEYDNSFEVENYIVKNVENEWLYEIIKVPYRHIDSYYKLIDMLVMPCSEDDLNFCYKNKKILKAARFNLPVFLPEYCKGKVKDVLSNVVYYRKDMLKETLKEYLPYTQCGKYKDNKNEFLDFFGENDLIESFFSNASCNAGNPFEWLKENELRELIEREQSNGNISKSLAIAKFLYEKKNDFYSFKSYVKALFLAQKYDLVIELCRDENNLGDELKKLVKKSESYLSIFRLYYKYCQEEKINKPLSNKSVYFLHSSLPYFSGGYATRAHGLATALIKNGLDVKAYTRPNFPYDVKKDVKDKDKFFQIDDITYYKTVCDSVRHRDEASYMLDCVKVFDEVIKKERPGYIHGRSTYQIALPALIAAKKNKLPFIYEVSGLWEIVFESRDTAPQRKHETEKIRHLETMTAKLADIVFTLTSAMKDELISRGVDASKITILPNCTNPDKFLPREKSQNLLSELGIDLNTPVIGYIGSFQDYEGLDDLIVACEILSDRKPDLDYKLLLVGDGPYYKQICDQAKSSSVKDKIIITGRVPHSLASEYYSIVDIAPFPRKSWPVCEMVSPMKPLEALAMQKTVLVSSVKALSEMVVDGETGVVFKKGSVESLSTELSNLLADSAKRKKLGKNSRAWVIENRTWNSIVNIYLGKVF